MTRLGQIVIYISFNLHRSYFISFWNLRLQDLKSEPTVEFLTSGTKTDDNMEFSDSESDEPRRYKSDAAEKNIANLKVNLVMTMISQKNQTFLLKYRTVNEGACIRNNPWILSKRKRIFKNSKEWASNCWNIFLNNAFKQSVRLIEHRSNICCITGRERQPALPARGL